MSKPVKTQKCVKKLSKFCQKTVKSQIVTKKHETFGKNEAKNYQNAKMYLKTNKSTFKNVTKNYPKRIF